MATQAKRGYTSRTIQGLFEDDGGYTQPITVKRLMTEGKQLELWAGKWAHIAFVEMSYPNDDSVIFHCGEMGYRAKYSDAVKVRVAKD